MFGFDKKKDEITPVTQERKFGPTKKLKNTYVITFDTMMDESVWQLCRNTKLAVKTMDGENVQSDNGWKELTDFPNPCAYNMVCAYKALSKVMGEKLASTIVVYGDKTDRETARIMLFPTNEIMFYGKDSKSAKAQLNHASRRDLKYQMAKRQKYLDMLNQKQY